MLTMVLTLLLFQTPTEATDSNGFTREYYKRQRLNPIPKIPEEAVVVYANDELWLEGILFPEESITWRGIAEIYSPDDLESEARFAYGIYSFSLYVYGPWVYLDDHRLASEEFHIVHPHFEGAKVAVRAIDLVQILYSYPYSLSPDAAEYVVVMQDKESTEQVSPYQCDVGHDDPMSFPAPHHINPYNGGSPCHGNTGADGTCSGHSNQHNINFEMDCGHRINPRDPFFRNSFCAVTISCRNDYLGIDKNGARTSRQGLTSHRLAESIVVGIDSTGKAFIEQAGKIEKTLDCSN